jgi:hypothetical protein
MSSFVTTFFDPGNVFGKTKTTIGPDWGNMLFKYDEKAEQKAELAKQREEARKAGNIGDPGAVGESDAQKIARQRMFRSGTVYTSTLGEDITGDQLAGARLR